MQSQVADEEDDGAKGEGRKHQSESLYEEPDEEDKSTLKHGRSVETAEDDDDDDDDDDDEAEEDDDEGELGAMADEKKIGILNQHLVDFGHVLRGTALELWVACELPLSAPRMLYVPLFEEMAKAICVKSTPGIQSAIALPPSKGQTRPVVQTAGVNFEVLANYADVIDLSNVRSNHIHAVLKFYGVEAARAGNYCCGSRTL